ncbi:MAG: thymidine kinase, partial [Proteobacteria bacterium]|nr:thymidine kinase [Pseudomonadota bacterium]
IITNKDFDFYTFVKNNKTKKLSCVLIDEAQFLSKIQVRQLGKVADLLNIPVMCYGIRTDFQGELFEGSSELLSLADNLIELKTICYDCGRKATMVVRRDENNKIVTEGSKVVVGGNDIYTPVCRKHFRKLTKLI